MRHNISWKDKARQAGYENVKEYLDYLRYRHGSCGNLESIIGIGREAIYIAYKRYGAKTERVQYPWTYYANESGFKTIKEMLVNFYEVQGMGPGEILDRISQIDSTVRIHSQTIREVIRRCGIALRGVGGPNNQSKKTGDKVYPRYLGYEKGKTKNNKNSLPRKYTGPVN